MSGVHTFGTMHNPSLYHHASPLMNHFVSVGVDDDGWLNINWPKYLVYLIYSISSVVDPL